jgi:hypothetical protein
MEKSHASVGTISRFLINEGDIVGLKPVESSLDVIDFNADVMDALAPLLKEASDTSVSRGGTHQLDVGLTYWQEGNLHLLLSQLTHFAHRQAQRHFVHSQSFLDIVYGNADVVDSHPQTLTALKSLERAL